MRFIVGLMFLVSMGSVVAACGPASTSTPSKQPVAEGSPSTTPDEPTAGEKKLVFTGTGAKVYSVGAAFEVVAGGEKEGVDAEYEYLATLRCGPGGAGGWKVSAQALVEKNGRPHDILSARCTAGGEQREFDFDISSFFGKGLSP